MRLEITQTTKVQLFNFIIFCCLTAPPLTSQHGALFHLKPNLNHHRKTNRTFLNRNKVLQRLWTSVMDGWMDASLISQKSAKLLQASKILPDI